MTVLGPDDPRAYKSTGNTWTDSFGKEHPIMLDPDGNEVRVVSGSIKDMLAPNFIEKLDTQLQDAGGPSIIDEVLRGLESLRGRSEAHSTVRMPSSPIVHQSAATKAREAAEAHIAAGHEPWLTEEMFDSGEVDHTVISLSEDTTVEDLVRQDSGRRRFKIEGSAGAKKVTTKKAPRKGAAPEGPAPLVESLMGAMEKAGLPTKRQPVAAEPKHTPRPHFDEAAFVPGRVYVIRTLTPPQRIPRESCLTFLGSNSDGTLSFNARPVAGTQSLDPKNIVSKRVVRNSSPGRDYDGHYINRKVNP
jgi:hypothetical protein